MAQPITLQQLIGRVETLPKAIEKALTRTFRRGLTTARTTSVAEARKRGVTRRIWGHDPSGLRKLFKRTRVRVEGSRITGGLEVKGLAAMVEQGGTTKAHQIVSKKARHFARARKAFEEGAIKSGMAQNIRARGAAPLAFPSGGGVRFAMSVNHPGSRLPAQPYMGIGLQAALDRFNAEADGELQKACSETVG